MLAFKDRDAKIDAAEIDPWLQRSLKKIGHLTIQKTTNLPSWFEHFEQHIG